MKLLVISHAAVIPENQHVYAELQARGHDIWLIAPRHWLNDYAPDGFASRALAPLAHQFIPISTLLTGRPQRHIYRVRPGRLLRRVAPDAIFVEEEPYAVPTLQWALAASFAGIPFGVQTWENQERPLPALARAIERTVLRRAAVVVARTPSARRRIERRHPAGTTVTIPPGIRTWPEMTRTPHASFTVGFAGRLVPEKGVRDLTAAVRQLADARLLVVGDGPLRMEVERELRTMPGSKVVSGVPHDAMADVYSQMDVLVLPSRSTTTWSEQFGRVLIEALSLGVPVLGSTSGEIPWVVQETGGGVLFEEGDVADLTAKLERLRDDPAERVALAERGRAVVAARFGVAASAAALDDALQGAVR